MKKYKLAKIFNFFQKNFEQFAGKHFSIIFFRVCRHTAGNMPANSFFPKNFQNEKKYEIFKNKFFFVKNQNSGQGEVLHIIFQIFLNVHFINSSKTNLLIHQKQYCRWN